MMKRILAGVLTATVLLTSIDMSGITSYAISSEVASQENVIAGNDEAYIPDAESSGNEADTSGDRKELSDENTPGDSSVEEPSGSDIGEEQISEKEENTETETEVTDVDDESKEEAGSEEEAEPETDLTGQDAESDAEAADSELLGDSEYFRGEGTESNPYLISDVQDLEEMALFYTENHGEYYFKLANDIRVKSNLISGHSLSPIPSNYMHFDGNGCVIRDLIVEGESNVALFQNAYEINNLKVDGASITIKNDSQSASNTHAGVICCNVSNKASNCTVSGDIVFDYGELNSVYIGGLFYSAKDVTDCEMSGELVVNGCGNNIYTAGIAYNAHKGSNDYGIEDCEMSGKITVNGTDYCYAAGIACSASRISNCISGNPGEENECQISAVFDTNDEGYSSSKHGYVYGIVSGSSEKVNNCRNYATLDASYQACGVVGSGEIIERCTNYGKLLRATERCGIAGKGIVSNCENHADIVQLSDDANGNFSGIVKMASYYCKDNANYGNIQGYQVFGIARSVHRPYDGEGDISISDCTNYGSLTGDEVYGIAEFIGNNNYDPDEDPLETISACVNEGKLVGSSVAGIVGRVYCSGTVENCYNFGDISGTDSSSGIIGGITYEAYPGGQIINCSNSGSLSGSVAGGIIYQTWTFQQTLNEQPVVRSCSNNGIITGSSCSGGIVAVFSSGIITQCSNSGEIIASYENAGGIIGKIFLNEDKSGEISNCYNSGSVTGTDPGGIIGNAAIYECNGTISVSNCYNVGNLTSQRAHHILGNDYQYDKTGFTFDGCYYPSTGHGGVYLESGETVSGMTECSYDELQVSATYIGWDFDSIWTMGTGTYKYPVLRNTGEKQYTITLDPNGGTTDVTTLVTTGMGKLTSLPRPIYEGMRFIGWFTAAEGGDVVTTSTRFQYNATIYAHWREYYPEGRVAITPVNPENGARTARFVDDGGTVNFEVSFTTSIPVKAVTTANGKLRIVEYDTDTVVYETEKDGTVKVKNTGSGSKVFFSFLFGGLKDGTRYYVEIDDGFLTFEDDYNYAFLEKGDWVFKLGSRVFYLEENVATQTPEEIAAHRPKKQPIDRTLPYLFDVDDSYFIPSSYEYNYNLALIAYGLTLSAFEAHNNNSYKGGYINAKRTFESFGFENFAYNDWYTKVPTTNSIGVCAATKVVNDGANTYTVIALPIRGAGYESEWAGNVDVDLGEYHKGFRAAADQVVDFLKEYIDSKGITGKVKIIVTGYSRAAGTANVTASLLDDGALDNLSQISVSSENIYGFCFEPPAVTTRSDAHSSRYDNICSFINRKDFVPKVPSNKWEYSHFGKIYYFNDEYESRTYQALFSRFLNIYDSMSLVKYNQTKFSPKGKSVPDKHAAWLDYLIESLSSSVSLKKYVRDMQGELWDILKNGLGSVTFEAREKYGLTEPVPNILAIFAIVLKMAGSTAVFLSSFSDTRNDFFANLSAHVGQHVNSGLNNLIGTFSDGSTGELLIQEHYPLVNLAWLMACEQENYFTKGNAKSMIVNCPVDVQLYDSETGALAASIIDGKAVEIDGSPVAAYVDYNDQKVFVLPTDRTYNVRITATDDGDVNYCLLEGNEEEGYTKRIDYTDIEVVKDDEITGTVVSDGTCSLQKDGAECDSEIQTVITRYEVTLDADEYGTALGSGTFMKNEFVIAHAIPDTGAEFDGWYDSDGQLISEEEDFRFRVDADTLYTAKFKEREGFTAYVEENLTYTGAALKPEVKVYDGVKELTAGKDYSISFKNNKNAYTYTEADKEHFDAAKAPAVVVTGKGNYKGKETTYFVINPKSIENDDVTISAIADQKEDGKVKKPVPIVKAGKSKLKAGTDFTVAYLAADEAETECKTAGEYIVRITGKGNYTGTRDCRFVIYASQLVHISKAKIQKIKDSVYNSEPRDLSPDVKLSYNKVDLTEGTDYEIVYNDDRTTVGKKSITIIGLGGFTGSKIVNYNITGRALNKTKISGIAASYEYTGDEIEPPLAITFTQGSGKAKTNISLEEDTDYSVEYSSNVLPGTARITITGKGLYTGTVVKSFKITGLSIKKAVITNFNASVEYSGQEIAQNAALTLNGRVLTLADDENDKNGDYIAVYSKNTNVGNATVTFKGINGYTDSIQKKFSIKKKALSESDFEFVVPSKWSFAKGGSTPMVTLTFKGEALERNKDYTVSYKNNKTLTTETTVKKPLVTVTGKGNFSGNLSREFTIITSDLSNEDITMTAKDVVATGKAGKWISAPVITDVDGKALKAGTDYEKEIKYYVDGTDKLLTASDTVAAGTTIKAVATGKGAYTNTIETTYRIVQKDISKATVKVAAKIYTGKDVTLSPEDITLTFKKEPMTAGDYVIDETTYKNNIKKGKASVVIRGVGDFGGSKTITFTIGAKGIMWWFRNFFQ